MRFSRGMLHSSNEGTKKVKKLVITEGGEKPSGTYFAHLDPATGREDSWGVLVSESPCPVDCELASVTRN